MNQQTFKDLLTELEDLYQGYSQEHRATTQPYHLQKLKTNVPNYRYKTDDELVREPLIEHVGSLPILATAIYPYIKDDRVNLEHALLLLAIHDIGELTTGDEMTFTKTQAKAVGEHEQALRLLPEQFHQAYLEMENKTTTTAQFAKSIDKLAPDLIDYLTPANITWQRYKDVAGESVEAIISMIKTKKQPYMEWDEFLQNFHSFLLTELQTKLETYIAE